MTGQHIDINISNNGFPVQFYQVKCGRLFIHDNKIFVKMNENTATNITNSSSAEWHFFANDIVYLPAKLTISTDC